MIIKLITNLNIIIYINIVKMSYYMIPKINNLVNINPFIQANPCSIFTSHSLFLFYNDLKEQLLRINSFYLNNLNLDKNTNTIDYIKKIVNPYEYIFSKVPGSKYSVSKLKPTTNLFYDLLEITNTLNIFDHFKNMNIKSIHISNNFDDSLECIELIRENMKDENYCFHNIDDIYNITDENKFHFIFYEINNLYFNDINIYISSLIKIVLFILKNQERNGCCLIKIDHMFHKGVVDILYILGSLYEKIYVIKPNTSNIISFEKYIVCKNLIFCENKKKIYTKYYNQLNSFIINYQCLDNPKHIHSIIQNDLPYYFINKIDDMNIIIGQQQLESIDQIINIFKNKNKDEKLDIIRKNNIQKSVNWCEKFKIPCNKFSEKINIFLPIIKKPKDYEDELLKEDICMEESIQLV